MFRQKLIKYSVQGVITISIGNTSGTFTIPQAVVLANTLIKWGGWRGDSAGAFNISSATLDLTGTTTVTATNGGAVGYDLHVQFYIVEYYSGVIRNLQRGTIPVIAGGTTGSVAITRNTAFNPSLEYLGAQNDNNNELSLALSGSNVNAACDTTAAVNLALGYQYYEM